MYPPDNFSNYQQFANLFSSISTLLHLQEYFKANLTLTITTFPNMTVTFYNVINNLIFKYHQTPYSCSNLMIFSEKFVA